jgi:hypothetical protein
MIEPSEDFKTICHSFLSGSQAPAWEPDQKNEEVEVLLSKVMNLL